MDILNRYDYHSPDMKWGLMSVSMQLTYIDDEHPNSNTPVHWHMESELVLVLEGELKLWLDGEELILHAYDAALITGGRLHGWRSSGCLYYCINYRPETLLLGTVQNDTARRVLLENPSSVTVLHLRGSRTAQTVLSMVEALYEGDDGSDMTAQGLLMMLYGDILRCKLYDLSITREKADKRVLPLKRVLQFVRGNYAEPITLDQLAGLAGMSPRYFCRYFQQLVHDTPISYLNTYRVEVACDRLINTDDAISDIAMDCGFRDVSYFARTFRRIKSTTPRAYRQAWRRNTNC